MSRAVTADHILFDECIYAFRPNGMQGIGHNYSPSHSYLLTSFTLPSAWQLPHCIVNPSIKVDLIGAYRAFISKVQNPGWVGGHNVHLYGIALSSIVSFISGKVCKSTRDDYLCQYDLQGDELLELAVLHPVIFAGTGSSVTSLSNETLEKYKKETITLITKLYSIPHSDFVIVMQAIRLVHLSLSNKKEDFGLAHLLVVSAIEAAAQKAIKIESQKNPKEAEWKRLVKEDSRFAELLQEYKKLRNSSNKVGNIKEQYIEFINKFAPASEWEQLVPHPWQDHVDTYKETSPDDEELFNILKERPGEKSPSDLTPGEIKTILADSYTHRSYFVHRGEQPPHLEPKPMTHFFQTIRENWPEQPEKLLPNYELLLSIAQHSIINWINTIPNEKNG